MYPNCSKSQEVQFIYDIFRICDRFAPPPLEEFSSTDPFPIVHFYYLENQENEEIKLVLKGFWCPIIMKLSGNLFYDVLFHLRPSPGASGTSTSSKTPGRDLEDRWSLDRLSDVQSSWNFQGRFSRMFSSIWDHHQVHQETPCPQRLHEDTWRTGEVLTCFLRSNLHETFMEASLRPSPCTSGNFHGFQDSRKILGGEGESWQASWCPIFMKLQGKLL